MKFGCSKIKRFIISFHWIFMFQNVDVPKCSLNFRFAKMWIFPVTHGSFGDSSRDFWTLEALLQRLLRYIFRRAGGGRKELYIFQLLQISQIFENTYLHIHIQITLYLIYNLYCVYTCIYIHCVYTWIWLCPEIHRNTAYKMINPWPQLQALGPAG